MAKITSKYQVTVPKVIAETFGLHPGDEIQWEAAGEVIRVIPGALAKTPKADDTAQRLRMFDATTEQIRARRQKPVRQKTDRGWTREELYDRGRSR